MKASRIIVNKIKYAFEKKSKCIFKPQKRVTIINGRHRVSSAFITTIGDKVLLMSEAVSPPFSLCGGRDPHVQACLFFRL